MKPIALAEPEERTNTPQSRVRILIVDDHEVVRDGLTSTLSRHMDFEVVGAAATGAQALDLARRTSPTVGVVDLRLPDTPGDQLCRELIGEVEGIAVIVLSTYINEDSVRRSLLAGASAYLTKAAGADELCSAIRRVAAGPMAPDVGQAPQIAEQLRQVLARRSQEAPLTPQEQSVLELAVQGLTNPEIGKRLCITESTVRFHLQKMKRRLGAKTKTDLIARALSSSLVFSAPEGQRAPDSESAWSVPPDTAQGLSMLAATAQRDLDATAVLVVARPPGQPAILAARAGATRKLPMTALLDALEEIESLGARRWIDLVSRDVHARALQLLIDAGWRSAISVPLIADASALGALYALRKDRRERTWDPLAEAFASHAAVMLAESRVPGRESLPAELPGLEQLLLTIHNFQELTPTLDTALAPLFGKTVTTGVMLHDEERGVLQMVPGSFGAAPEVAASYQIPTTNSRSNAARVFVTGRPYLSNMALGDPGILQDYVEAFHTKRLLSVPLALDGQRIGVLHIANKVTPFTVNDIRQIEALTPRIAALVAAADRIARLQRQQLLERIIADVAVALASGRRTNDFLSPALDELSTVTEASFIAFIPHDGAPTIWRHDKVEPRREAQVLEVGRGTTETIERITEPLHAGDPGWATFHVPVRLAGQLIGTFSTYRGRADPFWPSERRALSRLADLAALAWTMEQYQQQRAELARIDERERIGDDLHDDVAQLLFSAHMSLDDALLSGVANEDARSNILKARALLIRSDEALRNVIRQFSRDRGDDLAQRLAATVVDIERSFSVPIHLEIGNDVAHKSAELSEPTKDVLVKVARESLANAAKHGGPCRATVTVCVESGRLVLVVSDDGIGMGFPHSSRGHGLASLQRMVREHGAHFTVDSRPGDGTRVTVAVQLPSAN